MRFVYVLSRFAKVSFAFSTTTEFAKFTAVMTPVADDLTNRYSERKEKMKEGRLLTQAEKEAQKELNTTISEARKS